MVGKNTVAYSAAFFFLFVFSVAFDLECVC